MAQRDPDAQDAAAAGQLRKVAAEVHLRRPELIQQDLDVVQRAAAQPRAECLQDGLLAREARRLARHPLHTATLTVSALRLRVDAPAKCLAIRRTLDARNLNNVCSDASNQDIHLLMHRYLVLNSPQQL